jgi:hypothetical protein
MKAQPTLNRTEFVYNLSTAAYHQEWNSGYEKPGLGARILGFVIRILPKVGPLKALQFKIPTPQTEKLFETSVDKTLDLYRTLLTDQERKQLALENRDFDTGKSTAPGEYKLADKTYANLAVKLAERDPASIDPAVRKNVLAFFRNLDAPYATKRDAPLWTKTVAALGKLKVEPVASTGQ